MTLAAETRQAVRRHPFLFEALRAGVLNYTAAARYLDVGEIEPVAVALRRYAEDLPKRETESRSVRVTMRSGLGLVDGADAPDTGSSLLAVGEHGIAPDAGSLTGVLATGDVDATVLGHVLGRLTTESVVCEAAGVAGNGLVVVTGRPRGPDALRIVEDALSVAPTTSPTD